MNKVDMFICGDVINMFSSSQFIDQSLINSIKDTDYAICNFEGTCEYPEIKGKDMVHRPETLQLLENAGFDFLLLGNNHITDYGYDGLSNTLKCINKTKFEYIGAGLDYESTYAPIVKAIKGFKFGFINLCEAQVGHFSKKSQKYGYAWIGDKHVDNRILSLRKEVDYLLLFVHAGLENYKLPLIEFRDLYQHYCDLGVDVVIGSHPHIAQGIERYGSSIIFYSLGNFYFPTTQQNLERESWCKSFSIVLKFDSGVIDFDIIKHKTSNLLVSIDDKSSIDVDELSEELKNPFYLKEITKQNLLAFRELPFRLFREALNGTSHMDLFLYKIKFIVSYLFGRKSIYANSEYYRMSLLKRLVENETYRYLTIAALNDYLLRNERGNK